MKKIVAMLFILFSITNTVIAGEREPLIMDNNKYETSNDEVQDSNDSIFATLEKIDTIQKYFNANYKKSKFRDMYSISEYDAVDEFQQKYNNLKDKYKTNEKIAAHMNLIPWFEGLQILLFTDYDKDETCGIVYDGIDILPHHFVKVKKYKTITQYSYWSDLLPKANKPNSVIINFQDNENISFVLDSRKNIQAYYKNNELISLPLSQAQKNSYTNVLENINNPQNTHVAENYQEILNVLNDTTYNKLNYKPLGFDFDKAVAISNYYGEPVINSNANIIKYNATREQNLPLKFQKIDQSFQNTLLLYLYNNPTLLPYTTKKFEENLNKTYSKEKYNEIISNPNFSAMDKFIHLYVHTNYNHQEAQDKIKTYELLKQNPDLVKSIEAYDYNTNLLFFIKYGSTSEELQNYLNDKTLSNEQIKLKFLTEIPQAMNKYILEVADENEKDFINSIKGLKECNVVFLYKYYCSQRLYIRYQSKLIEKLFENIHLIMNNKNLTENEKVKQIQREICFSQYNSTKEEDKATMAKLAVIYDFDMLNIFNYEFDDYNNLADYSPNSISKLKHTEGIKSSDIYLILSLKYLTSSDLDNAIKKVVNNLQIEKEDRGIFLYTELLKKSLIAEYIEKNGFISTSYQQAIEQNLVPIYMYKTETATISQSKTYKMGIKKQAEYKKVAKPIQKISTYIPPTDVYGDIYNRGTEFFFGIAFVLSPLIVLTTDGSEKEYWNNLTKFTYFLSNLFYPITMLVGSISWFFSNIFK